MPPDERRAALIAATQPLLALHGHKITTRQIAEAAGVAEGTIFRVFPDKDSLVRSAVKASLDPARVIEDLDGIDRGLPLEERLTQAVRIIQRRIVAVFNLLVSLGWHKPPPDEDGRPIRPHHAPTMAALARVLEPDRDQFRCPVEEVVRVLRLLTFAGSHPLITDGDPLTAEQIASVLLDGVRRPC